MTDERPRAVLSSPAGAPTPPRPSGLSRPTTPLVQRAEALRRGAGPRQPARARRRRRLRAVGAPPAGERAPLIFLAALLDAERAVADHRIVAVIGNSLGWYTALDGRRRTRLRRRVPAGPGHRPPPGRGGVEGSRRPAHLPARGRRLAAGRGLRQPHSRRHCNGARRDGDDRRPSRASTSAGTWCSPRPMPGWSACSPYASAGPDRRAAVSPPPRLPRPLPHAAAGRGGERGAGAVLDARLAGAVRDPDRRPRGAVHPVGHRSRSSLAWYTLGEQIVTPYRLRPAPGSRSASTRPRSWSDRPGEHPGRRGRPARGGRGVRHWNPDRLRVGPGRPSTRPVHASVTWTVASFRLGLVEIDGQR